MAKKRLRESGDRKHLVDEEVERLIRAAGSVGRHRHRDALMIRMAYRHGLRASELCDLAWNQVDLDRKILHVRRLKGGTPATHDLNGTEVRELRRLRRESKSPASRWVFHSEQGEQMGRRNFALIVKRAGELAGIELEVHPHMLRHACGFALANRGVDTRAIQAWLGHTNIAMTVRYTALAEDRLAGIWGD